jgi:hypothetical protein
VRYLTGFLLAAFLNTANALTPPLDGSPGFFAGEWTGTGREGAYCYLRLGPDGWGWVLVDAGSGDWQGARIRWRNRQQSLEVEKILPLPASAELRVMPLAQFVLTSGFNQSLTLTWTQQHDGCQLQKTATTAAHLLQARKALQGLRQGDATR